MQCQLLEAFSRQFANLDVCSQDTLQMNSNASGASGKVRGRPLYARPSNYITNFWKGTPLGIGRHSAVRQTIVRTSPG
jgi:hypothetical protein